ncbi:helix-turn-helix transcriptional regulator [Limimaricola pyoseonensis]|uniref:LuxR family transcriptional regulator n=1 Tax=Limimaricola pyoseonensis TaxID=521013 RepID=A0A1G7ACI0_9RHOB|nr:helix-turn-helix transcriptional regulator [Limimaricola pyoseonensis]SDE12499.1 LuxR family transcriptional regulator [Limimaricola pyoseonensis]
MPSKPEVEGPALSAHLAALASAQDIDQLWRAHCDRMALYGFERLLCAFTRLTRAEIERGARGWVMLSTVPHGRAEPSDTFNDGLSDGRPGPRSWSLSRPGHHGDSHAGYTIFFRNAVSRVTGAIDLVARPGMSQRDVDRLWDLQGQEIAALNDVFHLKLMSLPCGPYRLTDRQREMLCHVADGHTTREIADLLGLTEATIEKHLRLAREALDARNTPQAVLHASLYNQIYMPKS